MHSEEHFLNNWLVLWISVTQATYQSLLQVPALEVTDYYPTGVLNIMYFFLFCRHIIWLKIHPDYIFLLYFLRCQLTVTVTLLLVLGPKVSPDDPVIYIT